MLTLQPVHQQLQLRQHLNWLNLTTHYRKSGVEIHRFFYQLNTYIMKHCRALYQNLPGIHSVDLDKLSPMSYHDDERWRTRDLPMIERDGLWYPFLYYKVTLEWWNGGFEEIKGAYSSWEMINPPVVCEDGFIWALKMGTNRLIALKHLCYTSVDAIYFEHPNDLIKTGIYLREEDPLHNE